MDAIEHLAETAWKTPESYFGFSPVGDDISIFAARRDELPECPTGALHEALLGY